MLKWLLTAAIAIFLLGGLSPWLTRLGIGRLPGDLRFHRKGRSYSFPFTSTLLLSLLFTLLAKLLR